MKAQPPLRVFKDRPPLWIELAMGALAMVSVWLALEPNPEEHHLISWAIWGVFVAEYGTRLALSNNRRAFVRGNLTDLIAIAPWDLFRAFRLFRLLRVLRLIRGLVVLRRVSNHISGILRTNGLVYVLLGAAGLIASAGLLITKLEPRMGSLADGIWWSIVTATTVGYGDISPVTTEGRIVAAILMLVGIGMIAMLTGSIATYFIGVQGPRNPHVRHVQKQLDGWDSMSLPQRLELVAVLRALANGDDAEARVTTDRSGHHK